MSDQVCLSSFDRKNYTLNKILSSFSMDKLNKVYEIKKSGIQEMIQSRAQSDNRRLIYPKFNRKYDSLMGQMFGSVQVTQPSEHSRQSASMQASKAEPAIRIKTTLC